MLGQSRGRAATARTAPARVERCRERLRPRPRPARAHPGPVGRRAPARRDRQVPDARAAAAGARRADGGAAAARRSRACSRSASASRRSGCGVVLVTHKLAEIRKVAHRVTVLRGGRVVAQSAAPAQEIGRAGAGDDPARSRGPRRRRERACSARSARARRRAFGRCRASTPRRRAGGRRDAAGRRPHRPRRRRRDPAANFTLIVNRGEIVGVAGVEGNGQSELGRGAFRHERRRAKGASSSAAAR